MMSSMRHFLTIVTLSGFAFPIFADEVQPQDPALFLSKNIGLAANIEASSARVNAEKNRQININIADAKTISKELKSTGLKKARAIVAYRDKNGPFKSIEDLKNVKGINEKWIEKNRNKVMVG